MKILAPFPESTKTNLIILFCLLYLLPITTALAAVKEAVLPAVPSADYIKYQGEGNFLSVLIPRDWEKSEKNHPYGDLTKIYGVKLTGAKNKDGAAVKISILYYAGEGIFKTADDYIRSALNSLVRIDYDQKTEITKTTLADRTARQFQIKTFELIYQTMRDMTQQKNDGIRYERVPPHKQVTMLQKFIVMPASQGFYVLHLNVPEDIAEEYTDIFAKITKSFMPLIQ